MHKVQPEPRLGYGKWLIAILVIHVILAAVYWHYTPYGAAPDEVPHARYIEHLVNARALPVYETGAAEGYEFYQPPLYYVLAVPFYAVGKIAGMGNPAALARLLSLILGGLSIIVTYAAVVRALPRRRELALASAGFVAFLPTHVMTSSMVSNDILMELVFGAALLLMAIGLTDGFSIRRSAGLGVIIGLGILTKMTCLALIPIAAVACFLAWKPQNTEAKTRLASVGVCFGAALVIGGWWFIRSGIVYGDVTGMAQLQQSFLSHSKNVQDWISAGLPPLAYLQLVIVWTFQSFWGVFGFMNVFMPVWIYWALAALSLVALAGTRRALKSMEEDAEYSSRTLMVFWITLALVAVAFLKLNMTVFQAQGRYLYPAMIPIALLWVLGLGGFIPKNRKVLGAYLAVGIVALVQIVALVTCILPGISSP